VFARLTLLEIDTLRIDTDSAVEVFQREVLPAVQSQPGYAGVLVLSTREGQGALLSFWDTAEAADAGALSGFYPDVLEQYMAMFRSPPGRERYQVAFAELPAAMPG
jgi:hypothetical protein